MLNKKNRSIIDGAFISSFGFLFSLINLITGSLFDVIFIYVITLLFYLYRKKYDNKMSIAVYISTCFIILLTGQIFYLVFLIFTIPSGIYYGHAVITKQSYKKIKTVLIISGIVKYFVVYYVLSSLLGLGSFVDSVLLYIQLDTTSIYFLSFATFYIVAILESKVIIQYSHILESYIPKKFRWSFS